MGSEAEERVSVVAEARKWLRTPYHPSADVLGSGVDCGMLLVRVFVDTGMIPPFDPRPYTQDWFLHQDGEKYLSFVFPNARRVDVPQPGDVAIYKYGRCYSHGGIVTKADPVTIVHAFSRARMVLEDEVVHNSDLSNPKRMPLYFSCWGVAE